MSSTKFIIISVLMSICINAVSQNNNLKRVEIEAKVKSDNYEVVPAGKLGVLVFAESDEKVKGDKLKSQLWTITLYDTEFQEKWSRDIAIANKLNLSEYKSDSENLYMSFNQVGSKKGKLQVLKIGIEEGNVKTVTTDMPNAVLPALTIVNGNVFVGGGTVPTKGQVTNRILISYCACFVPVLFGYLKFPTDPLLYYVDFSKGTIVGIHPKKKGYLSVTDLNTLDDGTTEALLKIKEDKKKKITGLTSLVYDSQGKYVREYKVKSKADNTLVSGFVSSKNGSKFIIGTYKKELDKDKRKKTTILGSGGANGVYFSKFSDAGKQEMIKFYDFTQFNGFEDFVSGKVIKKIEKKKKNFLIGYNLLVHAPVFKEDEIIVVSEAYYAEYHTETRTVMVNGKMTTQHVQVFDGYRTTHALVSSFNIEGELLWSSTFKINTLSFTLKKRIRVLPGENITTLAFNYGGVIYSKAIKGEEVVDISSTDIKTNLASDIVKDNYKSDMEYWYDNFYVAYGYQKIKKGKDNKDKEVKRKRNIFYFNKIMVE